MSELDDLNSTIAQNFEDENQTTASATEGRSSFHSYGVMVFAACAWTIVAVLGITGNTMVILAAILSEHVRTTTNVLVVNLSVADLWTSLSLPWSSVALLSRGTWPLSTEVPCDLAAFMFHTGLGASMYNLAFIALNRLVKITCPLATFTRIFSPGKLVLIVAASWLIPIFVIIFPLTIGVGALGYDLYSCTDIESHPRGDDYNLAQTIGFYPVPITVAVVSYVIIYVHIRRHFRKQLSQAKAKTSTDAVEMEPSATTMTSVTSSPSMEVARERQDGGGGALGRNNSRLQLQVTKYLFWVSCAFVLCISPYYILLFFHNGEKLALYGATILICNSCINPIIYAAKHPQFKKVLRPMLTCKWTAIPQPSATLRAILAMRRRIASR